DAPVALSPPSGRGADGILERLRGRDELRLAQVARRHPRVSPEALPQALRELGVLAQLLAKRVRQALAGQVVMGWAEATGREHQVVCREACRERLRDHRAVIGQLVDRPQLHAQHRELVAKGGRVAVERLPEEQLRTDRSEERRVGKECRSRWAAEELEKKKKKERRMVA